LYRIHAKVLFEEESRWSVGGVAFHFFLELQNWAFYHQRFSNSTPDNGKPNKHSFLKSENLKSTCGKTDSLRSQNPVVEVSKIDFT
jgi:hypothetical protein